MTQISKTIEKFNSISIPEYLLYESNIKTRDLIVDWIQYRKNEQPCDKSRSVIPEELKYSGWQTDTNDWGKLY